MARQVASPACQSCPEAEILLNMIAEPLDLTRVAGSQAESGQGADRGSEPRRHSDGGRAKGPHALEVGVLDVQGVS
jgi:hypothetical protein